MGRVLFASDDIRLLTAWISALLSAFLYFPRAAEILCSGTASASGPTCRKCTATLGRMRATLRRSSSSILPVRDLGPSAMSATPPRPTARYTASCVLGLTATGISLAVQPRRSELFNTAPTAPGWPSIWEYAARSARRPRTIRKTSRPESTPETIHSTSGNG